MDGELLCHGLIFGSEFKLSLAWTASRLNSNPKFSLRQSSRH